MKIPFLDLTRQYRRIKTEINQAVRRVHQSGIYLLGEELISFEKEFAHYVSLPNAVGVGSGTDALTLSLRALGFGAGDEVILPANVYPSAFGVAMSGVKLRLVDCQEDGNIDIDKLPRVISRKTKAIVVVHLYGYPADVTGVKRILKKLKREDINIIEDCAQAHGMKNAGKVGDVACFSFYPTKNLGAYRDAGMVLMRDKKLAEHIRRLRFCGEEKRYFSQEISGKSNLDELTAAVLRVKLKYLDKWNARRREIAKKYYHDLSGLSGLTLWPFSAGSCFHQFVILVNARDKFRQYLAKHGIPTAVHYLMPIHLSAAFKFLGYRRGDFPVAERLSREVVSLPIYPQMKDQEIIRVIRGIRECLEK